MGVGAAIRPRLVHLVQGHSGERQQQRCEQDAQPFLKNGYFLKSSNGLQVHYGRKKGCGPEVAMVLK